MNHWTLTVGSNVCALCSSTPHEQRLFQAKAQTSLAGFQDQVPHVSSSFIMFHDPNFQGHRPSFRKCFTWLYSPGKVTWLTSAGINQASVR